MKWASVLECMEAKPTHSAELNWAAAVEKLAAELESQLEGKPDLLLAFISPDFKKYFDEISAALKARLLPAAFIGCSAAGIIGGGLEVEQQSAISLTAAILPGVTINTFHITNDSLPDPDDAPDSWQKLMQVENSKQPAFVMLCDPFSFKVDSFIQGLDYAYPRLVKLGGLASGGHKAGENRLICDDKVYRSGVVGVGLSGNIQVDSVVAQGCRAIGKPSRVTKCDRNLLYELDGKPVVNVLRDAIERLPDKEQLAKDAIFLGVAMNEFQDKFVDGDFLVRNIVGIEPMSGALLVGEVLRSERTVQFHIRDAATSREDLRAMLKRYVDKAGAKASGALLFSCLGRGQQLYGRVNHDSDSFRDFLGEIPLGGFFCNGEIGPVGDSTFLHGYTSSFGIFKEKD
ncbi:FIST C-terminal domain-containing protein [soil metagenome]